ncbi:MAG: hypothetical protein H7345_07605, partial [Rubritepida sp.]|nr:hypothetical protein [Rubritepida sp.]
MRALIALLLMLAPAMAQPRDAPSAPRTTTTLHSEAAAVAPGQPFRVAIDQVFSRGWHSYWFNPGSAGAPIEVTWSAAATQLQFPAPHRTPTPPLVSFGYQDSVTYLATVTPPATLVPGDRFSLEVEARWLVCAEICIPEEGRFTLTLPVEATARPGPPGRFDAAEARLPRPFPFASSIGFAGGAGALELSGLPGGVREAFFFPAGEFLLDHAAPQPWRAAGDRLTLSLTRAPGPLPERVAGVLALTDTQGVRSAFTIDLAPGPMPGVTTQPLWQLLLLAGLGGLILNLMPCVFPILAMKAAALAASAHDARHARRDGLAFLAGVLTTFLLLAGVLLALRAGGQAIGWGFQLQSPPVTAGLALLMLAVALNLSGVFHVGAGLQGTGSGPLARLPGGLGAFFTGALAVVVAAPCTAPFMAFALGAALVMPWPMAMAVFLGLGLGLALPFTVASLTPGLLTRLPRPGPWMERLKGLLAFPMYATALWLAWVSSRQTGAEALGLLFVAGLLVALGAWLMGSGQAERMQGRRGRLSLATGVVALLLAGGALVMAARVPVSAVDGATAGQGAGPASAPWSSAAVAAALAEGHPVLVNFTADWCVT